MGDTTLTIDDATKERLGIHRVPEHESWDHLLNDMMDILPVPSTVKEDLEHIDRRWEGTLAATGGVVQFFTTDQFGAHTAYFPTLEAAAEHQDQIDDAFPREPEMITIGGADEFPVEIEGATYNHEGETQEVGLDIPGAFDGEDSHGDGYDYVGEPVYIHNGGRVVQQGVIEQIIHEDAHTGIILGHDHATEMLHHPDEQKREDYRENHVEWLEGRCKACGEQSRFADTGREKCPDCGSVLTEDAVWPPDPLAQFEEGDEIVTSERETAMEIVRVGESADHSTVLAAENHHGGYIIRSNRHGQITMRKGGDEEMIGTDVEVEYAE